MIFYDCSSEIPAGRRNCVYDREAEKYLKENNPSEEYSGNAVDMAKEMGVELLDEDEYKFLYNLVHCDWDYQNWLKTPIAEREKGRAIYGGELGNFLQIFDIEPHSHSDRMGWRGGLKV